MPVLRRLHLDLPALPRSRHCGTEAEGAPRGPVHLGDVVHPADELADDGARAGRDPIAATTGVSASGSRATALFGLTFIGGQVYEFTNFYREGLNLHVNLFGSTFFILTGLHGAHVTVGIFWLLSLYSRSMQGKLTTDQSEAVEVAGLYWHFVDIVWIFIFTAIYLVPYH